MADVRVNGRVEVTERFIYDTGSGSHLRTRFPAAVEDALGLAEFDYDPRGRITARKFRVDDAVHEFLYEYDAADRLTEAHYPDGEKRVRYKYSAAKLVRIPGILDNLDYGPLDQLQRWSLANGSFRVFRIQPS